MEIICQPLVAAMRRTWLQLVFRGTMVLIMLGTFACLAAQIDFVGAHFTAISRLLLLKVLPIWNWQPLYYENCMINNPFYSDYPITEEDCVVRDLPLYAAEIGARRIAPRTIVQFRKEEEEEEIDGQNSIDLFFLQTCEALETIDRLSNVGYRQLVDNYLSRDAPAIITDAMDSWAVMNTDYFWFDNITHVGSAAVWSGRESFFDLRIRSIRESRDHYILASHFRRRIERSPVEEALVLVAPRDGFPRRRETKDVYRRLSLSARTALSGERATDGNGALRAHLQSANRLVRPRRVPAARTRARGRQVVRPLAELRHQRRQGPPKVLPASVLPLQHGLAGALQLGAHVLGLQQPELQEGRARLRANRARSAARRHPAATHSHKSLQQLVPGADRRLASGRDA